jgi:Fur family ferric uptake transcriptional regulator
VRTAAVHRLGGVSTQAGYGDDNHHHVVCRSCGTVADIDCVIGAAPCLESSAAHGFLVDEAEVTFWGMCSDCQSNNREGTDHT